MDRMGQSTLIQCEGIVTVYSDYIVAYVDDSIARYYRSLIPKYYYVKPPQFPAHVTVLRKKLESLPLDSGRNYDRMTVRIQYESILKRLGKYWYLDCWSTDISRIRTELCLTKYRAGFESYHITIGNTKNG